MVKLKGKFMIILVIVLVLLSIGSVAASEDVTNVTDDNVTDINETLNTGQLGDLGNEVLPSATSNEGTLGVGEGEGNFTELADLIGKTPAGGTLVLNKTYKMQSSEQSKYQLGITINKAITIDGNGSTIDANKLGRIFALNDVNFILCNVILINGKPSGNYDNGGAIGFINSAQTSGKGKVSLVNCTIENCSSGRYSDGGGAINYYHSFGYLHLTNCNFVNNDAKKGGAIYVAGSFNAYNCTFMNNDASYGGAIYYMGGNDAIVDNCTFTGNAASYGGGAIYKNKGQISVINSRFINNDISGESTVYKNTTLTVLVNNQSHIITNSFEEFNLTASLMDDKNNTYFSNGLTYKIYGKNGYVKSVASDKFFNAVSSLYDYGDYNVTVSYTDPYGKITNYDLINATLTIPTLGFGELDNAIQNWNSDEPLVLYNHYVMGADEVDKYANGINITKAITIDCKGFTIDANNTGRIFNIKSTGNLTLINTILVNGNTTSDGGAILNYGEVSVVKCIFMNNVANNGGAIYTNSTCFVENSKFVNNSDLNHQAIVIDGEDGTIINSTFMDNSIVYPDAGDYTLTVFVNNQSYATISTFGFNLTATIIDSKNNTYYSTGLTYKIFDEDNVFVKEVSADELFNSESFLTIVGVYNITASYNDPYSKITTYSVVNATLSVNPNYNFNDLDSLISAATKSGETIVLNHDYTMFTNERTKYHNGISINKSIIIDGNGYTIDANRTGKIFDITTSGNLTLINANLINGYDDYYYGGGAISCKGCLYIDNCTFRDNVASCSWIHGGAIFVEGNNCSITNSIFNHNIIPSSGYGGAISVRGNNCSIVNCTFENSSVAVDAGAIEVNGANCSIVNCTFVNNTADDGGAIWVYGADCSIVNCTFVNNTLYNDYGQGDAIYAYNNCLVSGCTFFNLTNNTIYGVDTVLKNCTLTVLVNNTSSLVIYKGGDFNLNAVLMDNMTNTYYSEGLTYTIMNGSGSYYDDVTADELFRANVTLPFDNYEITATYYNPVIGWDYTLNSATIRLPRYSFEELQYAIDHTEEGGTLVLNHDYIMYDDEKDTYKEGINITKAITIDGNGFTINANKTGRIFNINNVVLTLNNITLTNGQVSLGAGIYASSGNVSVGSGVSFVNNTAHSGGAIAVNTGGSLNVTNCTFENNTAPNGNAIYNQGIGDVTNSTFINNNIAGVSSLYQGCNLTVLVNNKSYDIVNDNELFNLTATLVDNKNNTYYSTGLTYKIYNKNGLVKNVTADELFNAETSLTSGEYNITATYSGIYNITSYTVNNATVRIIPADSFTALDILIKGWTSEEPLVLEHDYIMYTDDGCIYINNKNITIEGNGYKIDANKTGPIFIISSCNLTLVDTYLTNGFSNGWSSGAITKSSGNLTVINCTFSNIHASYYCGAIDNREGYCYVVNSTFLNNKDSYGGAAIYNDDLCVVVNSTFLNNSADHGGAILNTGNCTLIDCTFRDNHAEGDDSFGGAISNSDTWGGNGNLTVTNCIFENNTAPEGSAIYNKKGIVDVTNSLFINNNITGVSSVYQRCTLTVLVNDKSYDIVNDNELFNLSTTLIDYYGNTYYSTGLTYKIYNQTGFVKNVTADELFNAETSLTSGEYNITATYTGIYNIISFDTVNNATVTVKYGTSLSDLKHLIDTSTTSEITLDRNYTYDPNTDGDLKSWGVPITKDVTIYGNDNNVKN